MKRYKVMASLKLVNIEEVSKFVQRCMCCVGTNPEHARQLADILVAADCRGHFSHGLNRLGKYVYTLVFHFVLDPKGKFTRSIFAAIFIANFSIRVMLC